MVPESLSANTVLPSSDMYFQGFLKVRLWNGDQWAGSLLGSALGVNISEGGKELELGRWRNWMVKTKGTTNPTISSGIWMAFRFVLPWAKVPGLYMPTSMGLGCWLPRKAAWPWVTLQLKARRGSPERSQPQTLPEMGEWVFGPERGTWVSCHSIHYIRHHLDVLGYLKLNMPQAALLLFWVQ